MLLVRRGVLLYLAFRTIILPYSHLARRRNHQPELMVALHRKLNRPPGREICVGEVLDSPNVLLRVCFYLAGLRPSSNSCCTTITTSLYCIGTVNRFDHRVPPLVESISAARVEFGSRLDNRTKLLDSRSLSACAPLSLLSYHSQSHPILQQTSYEPFSLPVRSRVQGEVARSYVAFLAHEKKQIKPKTSESHNTLVHYLARRFL